MKTVPKTRVWRGFFVTQRLLAAIERSKARTIEQFAQFCGRDRMRSFKQMPNVGAKTVAEALALFEKVNIDIKAFRSE